MRSGVPPRKKERERECVCAEVAEGKKRWKKRRKKREKKRERERGAFNNG